MRTQDDLIRQGGEPVKREAPEPVDRGRNPLFDQAGPAVEYRRQPLESGLPQQVSLRELEAGSQKRWEQKGGSLYKNQAGESQRQQPQDQVMPAAASTAMPPPSHTEPGGARVLDPADDLTEWQSDTPTNMPTTDQPGWEARGQERITNLSPGQISRPIRLSVEETGAGDEIQVSVAAVSVSATQIMA